MQEFIAKHQEKIAGTLSGFARLAFRGHLRSIGNLQGMMNYLWTNQVFLKNFGDHVEKVTERLKAASLAEAKAGRNWKRWGPYLTERNLGPVTSRQTATKKRSGTRSARPAAFRVRVERRWRPKLTEIRSFMFGASKLMLLQADSVE